MSWAAVSRRIFKYQENFVAEVRRADTPAISAKRPANLALNLAPLSQELRTQPQFLSEALRRAHRSSGVSKVAAEHASVGRCPQTQSDMSGLHVLPVRTAGAAENMALDFLLLQRYPGSHPTLSSLRMARPRFHLWLQPEDRIRAS